MLRLLIVDDEVESLEWLKEMFEGEPSEEINVYTAVSGKKAIEILNCVKCDVVLTDIKMPGMDGMELYRHVKENWPKARVVFLTGYSTHELLYQAVQDKEIRYLVKTESPGKIVDTVLETYHEQQEQKEKALRQEKKEELLLKAKYWLQKELIERLISGMLDEKPSCEQMDELGIPIVLDDPVILFLGRTNGEKGMLTYEQQESILLAVRENIPGIMRTSVYILESCYVLGIIQPKLGGEYTDWSRAFHVGAGALEDVQEICQKGLKITIPFAVYQKEVGFENLGRVYHLLKRRLMTIVNKDDIGILMVGLEDLSDARIDSKTGLIKLPMLNNYLEQGNYRACKELLKEITKPLLGISSMHDMKALELYYNISMIYLKYINVNGWEEKLPFYIGMYPLIRVDDFADWNEAADYLMRLTDALFKLINENDDVPGSQAIVRVEQYIRGHLKEDLGLQVLADVGGFNASYLSRIFKQKYHCNLYDYITKERISLARELLSNTNEKIYRIGEEVGYRTASSFNRAFLKSEGMTPAEYRMRYHIEK